MFNDYSYYEFNIIPFISHFNYVGFLLLARMPLCGQTNFQDFDSYDKYLSP